MSTLALIHHIPGILCAVVLSGKLFISFIVLENASLVLFSSSMYKSRTKYRQPQSIIICVVESLGRTRIKITMKEPKKFESSIVCSIALPLFSVLLG